MKYKIKGQKVVKEDFSVEIEATSYVDAFKKVCETFGHDIEVYKINDSFITNQVEADWQDHDTFSDSLKEVDSNDFDLLKEVFRINKGVKSFTVHFSGQGDDGQIDHVSCEPHTLQDVTDETVSGTNISNLLEQIAGTLIDEVPIDWVNDNGGAGQVQFKLNDQGKIEIEVSCHDWDTVENNTFCKKVVIDEN